MLKCPNCGKKYQKDMKYCAHCGETLPENSKKAKAKKSLFIFSLLLIIFIAIFLPKAIYPTKEDDKGKAATAEAVEDEQPDENVEEPPEDSSEESEFLSADELLEQAQVAMEEEEYAAAVELLDESLVLESDSNVEVLRDEMKKVAAIYELYVEDELEEAYDGAYSFLLFQKTGEDFQDLNDQVGVLKERIKTVYYQNQDALLAHGDSIEIDEDTSRLALEYMTSSDMVDVDLAEQAEMTLYWMVDIPFVEDQLFDGEFADGIYLYYENGEPTFAQIAKLGERLADAGERVQFYTKQGDQAVAFLYDIPDFFEEPGELKYYAVIKGKLADTEEEYRGIPANTEEVISYLEEIIEKNDY